MALAVYTLLHSRPYSIFSALKKKKKLFQSFSMQVILYFSDFFKAT